MTSLSVADLKTYPLASNSSRSGWKFSMTPLWTRITSPLPPACGCAFSSVGGPTRVPNPHGADRSGCADTHHQLFNSTDSSAHGQTVWSQDGNPGTVITAVFQTPQAIDQKW